MSFASNIGKKWVEPTGDQCEMMDIHHPDCECPSCKMGTDTQCLEPAVGTVPEFGGIRVCAECAEKAEREEFEVIRYG